MEQASKHITRVFNLNTGQFVDRWALPPEEAVVAAYLREHGDGAAPPPVKPSVTQASVSCGDFAALTKSSMTANKAVRLLRAYTEFLDARGDLEDALCIDGIIPDEVIESATSAKHLLELLRDD